MLTFDEWDLLQELILVLSLFEEATRYLGDEKYVTHSIMHLIIKEIKRLLLSVSTTSMLSFTLSNISNNYSEIENIDIFTTINEVEILENEKNNNNQRRKNKIDLNKLLETKDMLDKVKKQLYQSMCFYWKFLSEDFLISTILDPRVKYIDNEIEEEAILRKKYEEYEKNYLQLPIESRASFPTLFNISTFSTIIYQPKLFAIFKQNQPQVFDEVAEYLKEEKIPFNQNPFEW